LNCYISENKIYVTFDYDQDIINKCKFIGMRFNPKTRTWWIYDSYAARKAVKSIFQINSIPVNNVRRELINVPSYLMKHQSDAVKIAEKRDRYAIYFDTGVGKTLTALNIISNLSNMTLVVCPLQVIEDAWINGVKKFNLDISYCNIRKYNNKSFPKDRKMYLINYESFIKYYDILTEMNFDTLIVDESSRIKNPKAKITKAIIKLADTIPNIYLLSGNPAPNNEMEYFTQMRALDVSLFGNSFYRFRDEYFYSDYSGFHWYMKNDKREEFLNKIKSVSVFVKKKDVLDLPERTDSNIRFELSKDEASAYNDMLNDLIVDIEDKTITVNQAVSKIMKLRQIISGFIIDEDSNTISIGNSKLKTFGQLIEDIGDHQVIIWTQFKKEAEQIIDLLDNAVLCDSSVPYKNKRDNMIAFQKGDAKYMVAHPKSIGMGTTFVNCSYAVYYSLSYSYEEYNQSRDRIYRKGQKNKCSYYHILGSSNGKNLIDSVILNALHRKEKMSDAVVNYIQNL